MAVETIDGHPAVALHFEHGPSTLITVCSSCGHVRSILFLRKDRWYCTRCRAEGASPPNLYPIA